MALWLPRLPTDRLTRRAPSEGTVPLAVSARANNALYVHALNMQAARLGLYKSQPLASARAMVRELSIVPADEKADGALLENIADWCDRFTPMVACDAPDGLLLDITGATHLFGGEPAILKHVTRRMEAQGFSVRAAIAGTALCARALARHANGVIAPPGMEAAALAPLPVAALDAGDRIQAALHRAGLKTIAQVAARERSELGSRFGAAFVSRLDVLLGQNDRPITPRRILPDLMAEQRFAEPVVTQDAITHSLHSLAQSLGQVLEQRGLGLRTLEAAFFRADGALHRIAIRVGAPLRDPDVMLRLLREKLDALADPLDPGFGFDLIRLEAGLSEKTHSSAVSFDADENARAQVAFLVDRLSARFGEHRVLRFMPQDTHIPEAADAPVPAQDRDFNDAGWGKEIWACKRQAADPPRRPLRLFAKPEEIQVSFPVVPDGPPTFFRWRQCRHDVARAEGPERIAMEWWRQPRLSRDYFRVETGTGQRFWIYRDGAYRQSGLAPRWYLQGIFA